LKVCCITCWWRRVSWKTLTSSTPPTTVTTSASLGWSRGNPCHMTLISACLSLFVVQV
uniref:Uncharacterized protein n=1 Tax=Sus scrofa TaxID=9823 RepID=A0A8D0WEK3_PIG